MSAVMQRTDLGLPERRAFIPRYQVNVWEERDRLHIELVDQNGRQYADWWDDDARQMFEDGFFVRGSRLKHSVIDYAEYCGIIGVTA